MCRLLLLSIDLARAVTSIACLADSSGIVLLLVLHEITPGLSVLCRSSVDLSAVGNNIYTTATPLQAVKTGPYTYMSGTSFAVPIVAGTAALIASARKRTSGAQLKQLLMQSVDPKPGLAGYSVTGVSIAWLSERMVLAGWPCSGARQIGWPCSGAKQMLMAASTCCVGATEHW